MKTILYKMHKMQCCLFVVLFFTLPAIGLSQEEQQTDTAFINNYKRFRQLADPAGTTYSLYFVPDSASSKFLINDLELDMKEAYHFLRRKRAVKKGSDFQIAVLIDEFIKLSTVQEPLGMQAGAGSAVTKYNLVQPYLLTITLFIYANGKMLEFPLCVMKEFKKESKYGVVGASQNNTTEKVVSKVVNGAVVSTYQQVYAPPVHNPYPSYATALSNVKITKDDLKTAFRQVLWSYKNHYVDRVD